MFESDTPIGRIFDMVLIVAISLSILISFVETIPELARTFKLFSYINEGYFLLRSLRKSFTKITVYFLFVLILVTCLVHGRERLTRNGLHRSGHIRLLGHRHHDHRGLWRHHARHPYRPSAFGIRHAAWLHHHRRTDGYRHGQHHR